MTETGNTQNVTQTIDPNSVIIMPISLFNGLVSYLSTKPYQGVGNLMQAISGNVQVKQPESKVEESIFQTSASLAT